MSQFPGQPQFGNPLEAEKALKNKNTLTPNYMKAKLLKEIQLSGISGPTKIGEIIDVRVPVGGNKVYVRSGSTGKEIELTIGTDVELITDAPQNTAITKQQKGGLLFYGALAILGYIVYKVVTTK
jgi:hypothetical protein